MRFEDCFSIFATKLMTSVYTTLHGTFKPEKVASSFDEFLVNYIASRQ